jgi:hypothetical protein
MLIKNAKCEIENEVFSKIQVASEISVSRFLKEIY